MYIVHQLDPIPNKKTQNLNPVAVGRNVLPCLSENGQDGQVKPKGTSDASNARSGPPTLFPAPRARAKAWSDVGALGLETSLSWLSHTETVAQTSWVRGYY